MILTYTPTHPPIYLLQMLARPQQQQSQEGQQPAEAEEGGGGGAAPPVEATRVAENHEAFITIYVSADGHHWAITLEVSPLSSSEEEEEEDDDDEVGSVLSSLPTSPMGDRDKTGGEGHEHAFPPS